MDASVPVDTRVDALLSQMTNREKNAQLNYGSGNPKVHDATNASAVVDAIVALGGVGGVGCVLPAEECVQWIADIQRGLKAKMRIWIPAMQICESTHSGGVSGTTLFPMPVVMGQSWNVSLMEAIGRQQGLQARAGGCSQALSPVLQVTTDPRFGRVAENFGEDPHLVSQFGFAALAGIQGRRNVGEGSNASTYLFDPVHHPFCQAKHYAGYGAFPKDSYTSAAGISERTLYEVYLVPWRELVGRGLRGVMVSHNMLDGVPMHGNHKLLTGVLRHRFGLGDGGYIGSDAGNVFQLSGGSGGSGCVNCGGGYGVAANASDATALWLSSGGDQAMRDACQGLAGSNGSECDAATLVSASRLDQSVLDRAAGEVR